MKKPATKTSYIPQLDALRAFAVILVLIHHWLPENSPINFLPTGPMGVTMFFVLSGFLISRILLQNRESIENNGISFGTAIKTFYIRRSLRIFPIYFIVIFLCLSLNIENIRDHSIWFLTYTSNILHFNSGEWMGPLSHLWTLAVEEQYYLFVPFVLILVPQKYLLKTIWILILIGPATRCVIYYTSSPSPHPEILTSVLTLSAFDCFGMGTLLAYIRVKGTRKDNLSFDTYLWYAFIAAMICFAFIAGWGQENMNSLWLRTSFSIISLYIIDLAAKGIKGKIGKILENRFILYVGKISYGIYLFHMFLPFTFQELSVNFPENQVINLLSGNQALLFLVYFLITLVISSLSWVAIEKPINSLKAVFEYEKENRTEGEIIFTKNYRLATIAICTVLLFITVRSIGSQPNSKNSTKVAKIFQGKSTGLYIPDFSKEDPYLSVFTSEDIPFNYDIVSLYLAWGEEKTFDIPVELVNKLEKTGKKVFITWEPWTATFPSLKIENKEVHKAVCEGKFDAYLKKQCDLLKKIEGPVYIRWAHNSDKIDCPWAAISHEEIRYYQKAQSYLIRFFKENAPDKVKWVWPAPAPGRISDYYQKEIEVDYIGVPGINYGKKKKDKNWREFNELYKKSESELKKLGALEKTPVFLTEVGTMEISGDGRNWIKNARNFIQNQKEVEHCVLFFFDKEHLNSINN